MRLLLDTSAVLAVMFDLVRLGARGEAAILDPANEILVSPASIYEIEVKTQAGKLTLPRLADWRGDLAAQDYGVLGVTLAHFIAAARLPLHHRDPWDRLLIAQALDQRLTLVTSDRFFPAYGADVLW